MIDTDGYMDSREAPPEIIEDIASSKYAVVGSVNNEPTTAWLFKEKPEQSDIDELLETARDGGMDVDSLTIELIEGEKLREFLSAFRADKNNN